METLAIAISHNANQVAYAIRGELREDIDKQAALPRIDENAEADIFVAPSCSGFVPGLTGTVHALKKAEEKLVLFMNEFDYENQVR